ncbi:BTAD domain-containing putative transcriptional regulator [Actinomadura rupiterrae]|uniref:BTAD domain-containing putative transcriptional regulator n=1 Tax=Actinomadura rupiterrae TaxID=559627 RepID=UPI0020A2C468|nr:AfsR/SARP family transcriptional regulator [Actinomadura rupiterrae]MCP2341743.1 DNA-binding SARP family transcriptional activator [Actinomadura rupiterrae]
MGEVTFGVLGPLAVSGADGRSVEVRGARPRAVLARLLVAGGRVVPASVLVDDLWDGDPPEKALGAVQTFVGTLRRALEPDRPPRTPSRLLVTAPSGYVLRTAPGAVDATRFREAVAASAGLLDAGRIADAHARLDEALGWWRGPAYAEFEDRPWARGEITKLTELRLLAVERRARAALDLGRAAETVPDLEAHAAAHPLREDAWGLLALALYRSGRQGDALGALRRARDVLREELGLDPGEDLRRLEADILAQAPRLLPPETARPAPAEAPAEAFVGRSDELSALEQAAEAGRPALVSGGPGTGKTALTRVLAERLAARGWTTARGAAPEVPGAPGGWPWQQIVRDLVAAGHEPPDDVETAGADPLQARFLRHRAIAGYLARLAVARPLLLVFDDLHWTDEETLALLTTLVTSLDTTRIAIVGTFRAGEIPGALAETLARLARAEPARVYLGGLDAAEADRLVRALAPGPITDEAVRAVQRRSGGNPFFIRELVRLWESDGALDEVPAGVRDVLRHRFEGLDDPARGVLNRAAVLGDDIDLDVLIALGGDEERVLDAVESGLRAGFLAEPGRGRLAFAHPLIRETLYADLPGARRVRWHARIAELVERARPGDVEAIAHHLVRGPGGPSAARYARAAAERAERRVEPRSALRWWRAALDNADSEAGVEPREMLEIRMGLGRALALTGDLAGARRQRATALEAAEALADPLLAARVLGAFDLPANWTSTDDPELAERTAETAERLLTALPPAEYPAEHARLLATIAMELRADASGRGDEAAREAEHLARSVEDPRLLAFALNARYMQTFHRAGLAAERAKPADELLALAHGNGLVPYEILAHLILVQSRAALADFAEADRHADAADALADRYDLPLPSVFTDWYRALRTAESGSPEAANAYRRAAARLDGTGMSGVQDGLLPLALLGLRLRTGTDAADLADMDWGPYEPWTRPLLLLMRGRRDEAEKAARDIPPSPRDLLFEARTVLHAETARRLGDRAAMLRLRDELRPAAGELAGAGSGMLTFGPVQNWLDRLNEALEQGPTP